MNNNILRELTKECLKAYLIDEIPVGCVITNGDFIISKAHNLKETSKNPTNHAEIIAINKASNILGTWNLQNLSIFISLEPCLMCAGAIFESRIKNIYIGCSNPYKGFFSNNYHKYLDNINITWMNEKIYEFILNRFFKKIREL